MHIYVYTHMYRCIHIYIYIYIYVYTRVFPCASAHREERWNSSEVATIVSGSDPAVRSQILSQILSQVLAKSGNYRTLRALALSNSGNYRIYVSAGTIEECKL